MKKTIIKTSQFPRELLEKAFREIDQKKKDSTKQKPSA